MDFFTLDAGDVAPDDLEATGDDETTETAVAVAAPPAPTPAPTSTPTPATPSAGLRLTSRSGVDISRMFFFDFETAPHPERANLAKPLDEAGERPSTDAATIISGTVDDLKKFLKEANPPSDYLEEIIIAERAGKKRASVIGDVQKIIGSRVKALEGWRKSLSTDPMYCRIVAMGWAVGGSEPDAMLAGNENEERELLQAFWDLVSVCSPVVGFWHTGFDLPVACVRSALLGVEPSRMFDLPWDKTCLDLCRKLGLGDRRPRLKDTAKLMGIPIPEEGVDGSMVAELIVNDPVRVLRYVKSDVEVLRGLFHMFSGYLWV